MSSNSQRRRPAEKLSTSRHEVSRRAFSEIVRSLQKDMRVLMHGSGDVVPSEVNPESVRLLSELTANYIANLVHAAVDSHNLLNGGIPQPLPPPPLARSLKTALPRPLADNSSIGGFSTSTAADNSKTDVTKIPEPKLRKRRRVTDEFWDEPLPEPKIKNVPVKATESKGPKFEGVPVDEWVGVSGVDFFERHRARHAHVSLPSAIGTQSFIFPVCHDVELYGKVLEVQAARRNLGPLLSDPVIQDVVRKESHQQGSGALRKREKKTPGGAADDSDDLDSENEGSGAAWPGLDSLLPFHTTTDFAQFM